MCTDTSVTVPARWTKGGRIWFACPCCGLIDGGAPAGGEEIGVGCGHCPAVCTVQGRTAMFA